MPDSSLARRLPAVAASAAIIFTAVASIRPIWDPDLFWHLRTGELVAAHGEIPSVDVFSHTFAGRPLHLVDWLSDLVIYGAHRLGGLWGIEILGALLTVAIMTVVLARSWQREMPAVVAGCGLLLVYAGAAARIYARPQTFGLLLATLEVLLLERALAVGFRPGSRRLWWVLPPLLCLWSNLHGSSPLGLALLAVFAVGDLVEQRSQSWRELVRVSGRWLALGCASTVGMLVASQPIGRLNIGFMLSRSSFFHSVITEWQPTEWRVLLGPVGALGAVVLAGLVLDRRAVRAWEWLLVAFAVWLTSTAWRFVPFFALLAGPVGLRHVARLSSGTLGLKWRRWGLADGVAGTALVVAASVTAFVCDHPLALLGGAVRPAGGLAPGLFPEGAARFLARERPSGHVFNSFHWGGYLGWALPGLRVFIDGRTETLYDEAFLRENTDLAPDNWRALFAKYGVSWAVILPSPVEADIASDADWATVYFDDTSSIQVRRRGSNAALVERLGYRLLTPEGLRKGSQAGDVPILLAEARRAVATAPASGRARLALANALLAAGDEAGYEREAAAAGRLAPQVGTVWFRIGVTHLLTRKPGARAELERAVELAPLSTQFRETLALACLVERDEVAAARAISPVLAKGEPAASRLGELARGGLGQLLGLGTAIRAP